MYFPALFYAQPHAEEVCRKSGAWGAQRVVEKDITLLDSLAFLDICYQFVPP